MKVKKEGRQAGRQSGWSLTSQPAEASQETARQLFPYFSFLKVSVWTYPPTHCPRVTWLHPLSGCPHNLGSRMQLGNQLWGAYLHKNRSAAPPHYPRPQRAVEQPILSSWANQDPKKHPGNPNYPPMVPKCIKQPIVRSSIHWAPEK